MLPLYIVCHADCEPTGYLCDYLDDRNILYKKINVLNTDLSTLELTDMSGLVFMGGPHSVTDNHPWLADEIRIIQQAIEIDLPMMGVCLGAQLISKALGAEVCVAEHMETGWHRIDVKKAAMATKTDLNLPANFEVFEWHEDTFNLPVGAELIFRGQNIENQGYLYGRTLAMQFHLEMTESMVYEWLSRYQDCMPAPSISVQSSRQICENLKDRLSSLHAVADMIYDWWFRMILQNEDS